MPENQRCLFKISIFYETAVIQMRGSVLAYFDRDELKTYIYNERKTLDISRKAIRDDIPKKRDPEYGVGKAECISPVTEH